MKRFFIFQFRLAMYTLLTAKVGVTNTLNKLTRSFIKEIIMVEFGQISKHCNCQIWRSKDISLKKYIFPAIILSRSGGWIRTHHLRVIGRVLYQCAITASQPLVLCVLLLTNLCASSLSKLTCYAMNKKSLNREKGASLLHSSTFLTANLPIIVGDIATNTQSWQRSKNGNATTICTTTLGIMTLSISIKMCHWVKWHSNNHLGSEWWVSSCSVSQCIFVCWVAFC